MSPFASSTRFGFSLIEGDEFLLTAEDFQKIASIAHAETGIVLQDSKAMLVYSRLAKRLRALGIKNFAEYCALVSREDGATERLEMLAALTTNVTRFFREPHHFDHLKNNLLPPLIECARKGGRIRLWSAACSSGQEAYSIALTILRLMPDAASYDIKILATDIDPNVIAVGKAGLYDENAVAVVPADLRQRWFVPANNGSVMLRVADNVRALVGFRRLNLIGDWPMQGRFQAIFCRNVVIYFDDATQTRIWQRMVPLLDPEAVLYIGHSERITGMAEHVLRSDGITTYRLRDTKGRRE